MRVWLRRAAAARGAEYARTTSSARGPTSLRRPRRGASGPGSKESGVTHRQHGERVNERIGNVIGAEQNGSLAETHIARARVGAPVAHARHERSEALGDRVVLAVGASEAERIVGRAL